MLVLDTGGAEMLIKGCVDLRRDRSGSERRIALRFFGVSAAGGSVICPFCKHILISTPPHTA